ncbi:hypothetical protein HPB50_019822 [Hyalomma asiaticum]|uniref:Uncharacterized protein n=1 Tax=Hyalomma asiaticum TaxID=266040 RepID=A0ACB7RV34_HYAAI|nr:hypothetical protein HPB50_019822 [Hyalomma asiaticum]
MKTFVLVALFGAAIAAGDFDSQCTPTADPGPCMGYFPMWWYNVLTSQCEEFIYGGCQGNDNKYQTKEECEKTCADGSTSLAVDAGRKIELVKEPVHNFACLLPPDQGPCHASITRYYYDNVTRTCKEFTYGGCEGNSNNYETVEECTASCNPATEYEAKCLARPETGPCRAAAIMWAYDAKLGKCKTFTYGGCDGNANKYPTKEVCEKTCKHPTAELVEEYAMASPLLSVLTTPLNAECSLPKDPGPCLAYVPRYYYSNETQRCEYFVYGGCQGNANNFPTYFECRATCVPTNPVCYEPKEVGPCKAYVPRYFYNTTTKYCERFVYGGCQGNRNNFPELEVCLKTCTHKHQYCYLPKDSGPCYGYFPRYYYNTTTNTCEEFVYGGCEGNMNNFKTLHKCESKCGTVPDPVCYLPKDKGPCRGYLPRYYYEPITETCEEFFYGGCQGNPNNFHTLEHCQYKCVKARMFVFCRPKNVAVTLNPVCKLPKKVGPCRARVPRYYYNTTTGTCEFFVYGGCQGNANNFKTLKECELTCGGNVTHDDESWNKHLNKPLGLNPVCNETKYPGPCFGYFPRYYFNNVTKTCEQFIYGGCRGNGNNFHTLEECQNTCWASLDQHSLKIVSAFEVPVWPFTPSEVCTYPADAGLCNAYMPRFFYNTLTKTCEQFVYGGCGGNQNNFHTYDACKKKCLSVFGVIPRA